MRKVLIISYAFPPYFSSGVPRIAKFTKYLPHFGWEPIVLTASEGVFDTSFLNDLPDGLQIYRSFELNSLFRYIIGNKKEKSNTPNNRQEMYKDAGSRLKAILRPFSVPDIKIGWYPFAVRKGKKIFKANNMDVIYSTSPWPTAHLIAWSLAKKYNKPWVADFRDPWAQFFQTKRPFPLGKLEESMEKGVLNNVQRVIIAWPGIQDLFMNCSDAIRQKTVIIHNGFDEQDFHGVTPKAFCKFTIIYAGVFYKERNPEALFKALAMLLDEKPALRDDIQIILIGREQPFAKVMIRENKLNDIISVIPHIPHRQCLEYLMGANALLLNTIDNYVPGKTFEYLRCGKPILALMPDNTTVANIIKETKRGEVLDSVKTEIIKRSIQKLYEQYKQKTLFVKFNDNSIYKYERKNLTGKLAKVFDEVTGGKFFYGDSNSSKISS